MNVQIPAWAAQIDDEPDAWERDEYGDWKRSGGDEIDYPSLTFEVGHGLWTVTFEVGVYKVQVEDVVEDDIVSVYKALEAGFAAFCEADHR